jgi:hypothetical protein
LGVEAVKKPFGPRLGAPVPLVVWYQGEQTMTRAAEVFGNILDLLLTPPNIEVLDGRKPGPGDVLGRTHYPLSCLAEQLPYQAVMQPVRMLSMVQL